MASQRQDSSEKPTAPAMIPRGNQRSIFERESGLAPAPSTPVSVSEIAKETSAEFLSLSVLPDSVVAQQAASVIVDLLVWKGDPEFITNRRANEPIITEVLEILMTGTTATAYGDRTPPTLGPDQEDILMEAILRMGQESVIDEVSSIGEEAAHSVHELPVLNPAYVSSALPLHGRGQNG